MLTVAGNSVKPSSAVMGSVSPAGRSLGASSPVNSETSEDPRSAAAFPREPLGDPPGKAEQQVFSRTVLVNGAHGLHLRPCSAVVSAVRNYRAKVTIHKGAQAEDAASILGLLSLVAARGTTLVLSAMGPEAEEALEAILPIFAGAEDCG